MNTLFILIAILLQGYGPGPSSIITHHIRSEYQEGNTPVHVLLPDDYDTASKYKVLYVLPVGAGGRREALELIEECGIHNRYQLIVVYPNMAAIPWYGDHPLNPRIRQESYIRDFLVPFIESRYSTYSGKDSRLLLGFSKSGWGAFSLLLRNPDYFGYAASWDAPMFAEQLVYGMENIYGSVDHMKRHEPSTLVSELETGSLNAKTRFVLTGENLWGQLKPSPKRISHTHEMREVFKKKKIEIIYNEGLSAKHTWNKAWLEPVIEYLVNLTRRDRDNAPERTGD